MSKRGRPTKFNAKAAATILEAVRAGVPTVAAAVCAEITPQTLNRWLRSGRTKSGTQFSAFVLALEQAKAAAHARLAVATYENAMVDGKLGLSVLTRRYPKDWAEKDSLSIHGEGAGLVVEIRKLSAD